jgi:hypothetical protein
VDSAEQPAGSPLIVPVAFFLANYLFILVFLRLNWPRYYLPTLAGACLLASIGLSAVASQAVARGKAWMAARRFAGLT